ncbi:ferritin-like domain-containing protein [Streptosporangium sp. NPDC001682]
MTDILGSIIRRMRERIATTEKPDLVTQDLLIEITQDLEKHHWMIEAQR